MNFITHWRQRPGVVGVDIAPDAIRLLQLARINETWQVSHHACEPLPAGAVMEWQVVDRPAVGTAIARARRHSGTRTRNAVIALAPPAVKQRLLSLPADLNEADLEAQIELEAARILPATNSLPHLDFTVLDPPSNNALGQVQALLAVADPETVRRCVAVLQDGGLHARAVDLESLALARAFTILTHQSLTPEQMLALSRNNTNLPDPCHQLAREVLALTGDGASWLLACGLALWGHHT